MVPDEVAPWGYIMQSRTILVLRLIPDKGISKALSLFIAMRGISNNFLVHLPSWHDELRVCKEKQIKLLLMFQNVIRLEKTSNSESVSLPVWRLEIFCWGDMKKNLIKGRSLESVWSLLKVNLQSTNDTPIFICLCKMNVLVNQQNINTGPPSYRPNYNEKTHPMAMCWILSRNSLVCLRWSNKGHVWLILAWTYALCTAKNCSIRLSNLMLYVPSCFSD